MTKGKWMTKTDLDQDNRRKCQNVCRATGCEKNFGVPKRQCSLLKDQLSTLRTELSVGNVHNSVESSDGHH